MLYCFDINSKLKLLKTFYKLSTKARTILVLKCLPPVRKCVVYLVIHNQYMKIQVIITRHSAKQPWNRLLNASRVIIVMMTFTC